MEQHGSKERDKYKRRSRRLRIRQDRFWEGKEKEKTELKKRV